MKTQRDWLTAVVMYIKCTRVASKRGITDDGRHAESRCTRLYLLLREKRNSCRACMRFARPPLPRTRIRRESLGRNRSDPWSHRIRARVCVRAWVTWPHRVFGEIGIGEDRVWPACKRDRSIFYRYFFYDNLVQCIIWERAVTCFAYLHGRHRVEVRSLIGKRRDISFHIVV